MAIYIRTTDNLYPVGEQFIRDMNPTTSFATPFVAPEEYAVVHPTPQPKLDNEILQAAREITPKLSDKGQWYQQWEVVDKFFEYTREDGTIVTKAEQEAAAVAQYETAAKERNKDQASRLLEETDWVENPSVSDNTKPAYLSNYSDIMGYRMALRLIAIDPPVTVESWPVKPDNVWTKN